MKLLHSHRVEYLLVGGYAVCYHGYYRTTADMDLWIAVHRQNAAKMVPLIREFGFDVPELSEALFLQKGRIIRMGVEPVRIQVLTEISGCEFAECYSQKVEAMLDGVPVKIIGLADLIKNKLRSGRLKDLDDARKLS
ncbi:MAG TPA: nucleotidyltransferase [Verrucomicrobiota bacterium]|nr:nucleotidyltransferase [Verrucomicrobiota bacterium]HQL79798.1 nucleotidyltransferase [Verrucomicrobiota bacterium]